MMIIGIVIFKILQVWEKLGLPSPFSLKHNSVHCMTSVCVCVCVCVDGERQSEVAGGGVLTHGHTSAA